MMKKNELLENIRFTRHSLEELNKYRVWHEEIYKGPLPPSLGLYPVGFFIFGSLLLMLILDLINIEKYISFVQYFFIFVFLLVVTIIFIPCYRIYAKNYNQKAVREKIEKNQEILKEWEQEWVQIKFLLFEQSCIPQNYWNSYVLQIFEDYLLNQRADSLKECINLLEQERWQNEQLNQLYRIEQQQAKMNDRIQDVEFLTWLNMK